MKRLFRLLFIIALTCQTLPLHAEVERVTIKWTPGLCLEPCLQLMLKQFSKLTDIAEIRINGGQGQMTLRYKPKTTFSYADINRTIRSVGPAIQEFSIAVRGTITYTKNTVTLESLGDNSKFVLMSPIQSGPDQAAAIYSREAHKLKEETRQKLIEASNEYKIVSIEGPLLLPETSPPLMLIIQKIAITPSLNPKEPSEENLRQRSRPIGPTT